MVSVRWESEKNELNSYECLYILYIEIEREIFVQRGYLQLKTTNIVFFHNHLCLVPFSVTFCISILKSSTSFENFR